MVLLCGCNFEKPGLIKRVGLSYPTLSHVVLWGEDRLLVMSTVQDKDGPKKYYGMTGKEAGRDGNSDSQDGSMELKLKRQVTVLFLVQPRSFRVAYIYSRTDFEPLTILVRGFSTRTWYSYLVLVFGTRT